MPAAAFADWRDRAYLVEWSDGAAMVEGAGWTFSGRQWPDGCMVLGSTGVRVRQELPHRARPRMGMRSRDFMDWLGVGDS